MSILANLDELKDFFPLYLDENYLINKSGIICSKKRNVFNKRLDKNLVFVMKYSPIRNNLLYRIVLTIKGVPKSYPVYQLVAHNFLPNPNGFKTINFKDGNKKNHHADNLEWCNPEYISIFNGKSKIKNKFYVPN